MFSHPKLVAILEEAKHDEAKVCERLNDLEITGDSAAYAELGLLYLLGFKGFEFIDKDPEKGVNFITLAVEKGHAQATHFLAKLYEEGSAVEKNEKEAIRLYYLAMERNFLPAINDLAVIYKEGLMVQKDEKESLRLLRLAADLGDDIAQLNLAEILEKGLGIEQNKQEAVRFYHMSAESGNIEAQMYLAGLYELGLCGLKKNVKQALYFYKLAAVRGNEQAHIKCSQLITIKYSEQVEKKEIYQSEVKTLNTDIVKITLSNSKNILTVYPDADYNKKGLQSRNKETYVVEKSISPSKNFNLLENDIFIIDDCIYNTTTFDLIVRVPLIADLKKIISLSNHSIVGILYDKDWRCEYNKMLVRINFADKNNLVVDKSPIADNYLTKVGRIIRVTADYVILSLHYVDDIFVEKRNKYINYHIARGLYLPPFNMHDRSYNILYGFNFQEKTYAKVKMEEVIGDIFPLNENDFIIHYRRKDDQCILSIRNNQTLEVINDIEVGTDYRRVTQLAMHPDNKTIIYSLGRDLFDPPVYEFNFFNLETKKYSNLKIKEDSYRPFAFDITSDSTIVVYEREINQYPRRGDKEVKIRIRTLCKQKILNSLLEVRCNDVVAEMITDYLEINEIDLDKKTENIDKKESVSTSTLIHPVTIELPLLNTKTQSTEQKLHGFFQSATPQPSDLLAELKSSWKNFNSAWKQLDTFFSKENLPFYNKLKETKNLISPDNEIDNQEMINHIVSLSKQIKSASAKKLFTSRIDSLEPEVDLAKKEEVTGYVIDVVAALVNLESCLTKTEKTNQRTLKP